MKSVIQNNILKTLRFYAIGGGGIFCLILFFQNNLLSQKKCDPWNEVETIEWMETFNCYNFPIFIGQPTDLSEVVSGTSVSNRCFYVSSNLNIDVNNVSITNCKFIFSGMNAGITVDNNITCSISGSQFRGVNFLWKGIKVRSSATLLFRDNEINDAKHAILCESTGSVVDVRSNKFNRNYIGIKMGNTQAEVGDIKAHVYYNYFNCTSKLKPESESIESTGHSFAAIYMNKMTFNSTVRKGCNFSYITNHANGIICFNSDISLSHYLFSDIEVRYQKDPFEREYDFSGHGITINPDYQDVEIEYNGYARLVGWKEGNPTTMKNVNRGIDAHYSGTFLVKKHRIVETLEGILGAQTYRKSNVSYNVVENAGVFGIAMGNLPDAGAKVVDNTISTISGKYRTARAGLYIGGSFSKDRTIEIRENGITHNRSTYGIFSVVNRNIVFSNNDVNITGESEEKIEAGFFTRGGRRNRVTDNDIEGVNSQTDLTYPAYLTWASPFTKLFCNQSTETPHGFEFAGNSMMTVVGANIMNNHKYGIYYTKTGQTGYQRYTHNQWRGIYHSGYRSIDEDFSDPVKYWAYYNDHGTIYDPNPSSPNNDIGDLTGSGRHLQCARLPRPLVDTVLTAQDSLIAIDSLSLNDYPVSHQWQLDYILYDKIQHNDIVIQGGSVYDSFMQDCSLNGIADYDAVDSILYNALRLNETEYEQVNYYTDSLHTLMEQLSYYDSLYINNIITSTTYYQYRSNVDYLIETVRTSLNSVYSSFLQDRENTITTVLPSLITSLPTSNEAAAIQKKVYDYYGKFIIGALSSADSADIISYDNACLERYQNGLLYMQGIAEMLGDTQSVILDCAPPQLRESYEPDNSWTVFPNPVKGNTVDVKSEIAQSGEIKIFSAQGKLMYRTDFFSQKRIRLRPSAEMFPGVYYIHIDTEKGSATKKVIIQ